MLSTRHARVEIGISDRVAVDFPDVEIGLDGIDVLGRDSVCGSVCVLGWVLYIVPVSPRGRW